MYKKKIFLCPNCKRAQKIHWWNKPKVEEIENKGVYPAKAWVITYCRNCKSTIKELVVLMSHDEKGIEYWATEKYEVVNG